ncbi:MAG: hypothetical protein KFB97_14300 [Cyanobium sp. M30B3]|nr:MAG: hypothetical protein KFB97_14300 [Cyanobium sp. M30B3]
MGIQASPGDTRPPLAFRKPQRITITIPHAVYENLSTISFRDGRSMSNLASFLLERAINNHQ